MSTLTLNHSFSAGSSASTSTRQNLKAIAAELAAAFEETAIARDQAGGTALKERGMLRESGLLNLMIPRELGGHGAGWPLTLEIVQMLAQVDGSLAHLFGFQHLMLATVDLFGTEAQKEFYFTETVEKKWFWGNALNPLDVNTLAAPLPVDNGDLIINGRKGFCSGSVDADALIVSARKAGKLIVGAMPAGRKGLKVLEDWDCFGQRQTDSGTVEFVDVVMHEDEILKAPGPLGDVRATLRPCLAQLILSNIYLGIALGAFSEAREYTLTQTRPWVSSRVSSPREDPYILGNYGNMFIGLRSAEVLVSQAAQSFDEAWVQGRALTEKQRGRCALDIASAKVASTRVALDITNRMFEVMGSRATSGAARLDRFWRNVRTHTLHDPVDYKVQELGNWALNRTIPTPSFYS